MTFKLRIRTKNGQMVLDQLTPDTTFGELKQQCSQLTKISARALKIFHGYPPKRLNTVADSVTLSALNLRSGDSLTIEEDPDAGSKIRVEKPSEVVKTDPLPNLAAKPETVATLPAAPKKQETGVMSSQNDGILTRRVVPADNSCLFTSIDFVVKDGRKIDPEAGRTLRQLIARIVAGDPAFYNAAFLGKSNADYCSWILNNSSWGGAIEVSILSENFQIEVDVIDTQTGRINRFGEDKNYRDRVFLFYDGIHYDPIVLENFEGTAVVRTKFSVQDEAIFAQALEVGAEAKSSRQFTNIDSGTMKCLVCNVYVRGEIGLKKHLMETGHTNFSEV